MSDEIKVGDRFLIEVVISSAAFDDFGNVYAKFAGFEYGTSFPLNKAILAGGKRLPRPIKAGDTVLHLSSPVTGKLEWRDDTHALARWPVIGLKLFPLSELAISDLALGDKD